MGQSHYFFFLDLNDQPIVQHRYLCIMCPWNVCCVSLCMMCGVVCDRMMWRLSTSDQQTFQTINWGNNVVTSSSSHSPCPVNPWSLCNMKHYTVLVTWHLHLLPNPAQLWPCSSPRQSNMSRTWPEQEQLVTVLQHSVLETVPKHYCVDISMIYLNLVCICPG